MNNAYSKYSVHYTKYIIPKYVFVFFKQYSEVEVERKKHTLLFTSGYKEQSDLKITNEKKEIIS